MRRDRGGFRGLIVWMQMIFDLVGLRLPTLVSTYKSRLTTTFTYGTGLRHLQF